MGDRREGLVEKELNSDIRQFIIRKFPLARKRQILDSDPLLETGMLDSQGVLEVVGFIEETFSITVADEDLVPENFQNIDRIAAFVGSKTNAMPSA
jgi:acyl carrier protein